MRREKKHHFKKPLSSEKYSRIRDGRELFLVPLIMCTFFFFFFLLFFAFLRFSLFALSKTSCCFEKENERTTLLLAAAAAAAERQTSRPLALRSERRLRGVPMVCAGVSFFSSFSPFAFMCSSFSLAGAFVERYFVLF